MEAGLTIDSASKSSLSSASFSFIAATQMRGDDRSLSFNRCCDAGVDSGDVEIGGNGSSSIVSAIETTFDDFRAFAASIRRFVASSRLERSLPSSLLVYRDHMVLRYCYPPSWVWLIMLQSRGDVASFFSKDTGQTCIETGLEFSPNSSTQ